MNEKDLLKLIGNFIKSLDKSAGNTKSAANMLGNAMTRLGEAEQRWVSRRNNHIKYRSINEYNIKRWLKRRNKQQYERLLKQKGVGNKQTVEAYNKLKVQNPREIGEWEDKLTEITKKIQSGRKPTASEAKKLDTQANHFTKTYESRKVNSSWILEIKYKKKSKSLGLKMSETNKWYWFNRVPFWVYWYILNLPEHAGTHWWAKGFGVQYSSNPQHWMRKGK